jgi:hypothetical protein
MTQPKKPSRAELSEQKLRVVRGMINEQIRRSEIKRVFAATYKCSGRTAERFIAEAYEQLRAESDKSLEEHRSDSFAFWQSRAANSKLPERERMRARENLDKLSGVYAAVKVAPTNTAGQDLPVEATGRLTMKELDAVLDQFATDMGLKQGPA